MDLNGSLNEVLTYGGLKHYISELYVPNTVYKVA